MISYAIKAIPTTYNGVRYRSRLEARWAAFFDVAGWPFQYEPIDFGDWSPDFHLHTGAGEFLVEVKPVSAFDFDIAAKMYRASLDYPFGDGCQLLMLGLGPEGRRVGWSFLETWPWNVQHADWRPWGSFWNESDIVHANWAKAANAVQWRGKDAA